jgi:transposase
MTPDGIAYEETEMPLYGGIDLHANNSVVVLLNERDEVIYQKRLPNNLTTILEQLAPYHTEMQGLVVESTYNWYWLVDGLMEAGYRVHLANPAAMQQYGSLKYTDDYSDARWLAHLLRLGVLPEGYIGFNHVVGHGAVIKAIKSARKLVSDHRGQIYKPLILKG